jgi:hypothetical protein
MIANANHALFEAKTGCVRELGAQVGAGKSLYAPQALNIVDEWLQKLKTSFDRKENK